MKRLLLLSVFLVSVFNLTAKAQTFNAATYGTVLAWYRAEDVTGVDGTRIATWPDHSGNGWDLTQPTGIDQPTLKTGILGGKSVIRFNHSDADNVGVSITGTVGTIVAVVGHVTYTSANAVGGTGSKRIITFFPDALTLYSDSSDLLGTSAYRVNAVSTSTFPGSLAYAVVALTGTPSAPGTLVLGQSFVNDAYDGDIAEFVLYSNQLSTANQDGAANDLRCKYGLVSCGAAPSPSNRFFLFPQ